MRRIQLIFIELQLPTLVEQPPRGKEWIHEIKQDGYRTLFVVEDGRARAYTGTGLDWIVQDERGDALMSAIRWRPHKLIFYAFDLLHLERALLMRPEQFLHLRATSRRSPRHSANAAVPIPSLRTFASGPQPQPHSLDGSRRGRKNGRSGEI